MKAKINSRLVEKRELCVAQERRSSLLMPLTLISPYGLAGFSVAILLAAYMIPPAFYEGYVREPDLLWSTPEMPIFYCTCILAFLGGVKVAEYLQKRPGRQRSGGGTAYNFFPVTLTLLLACILSLYSFFLIVKNSPGMLQSLMSGAGADVKKIINSEGALTNAQPFLMCAITWGMYRYMECSQAAKNIMRSITAWSLVAACVLAVAISAAKVARYEIVPFLIQVTVVYLFMQVRRGASSKRLLAAFGILAASMVFVFVIFATLRQDNFEVTVAHLLGYSVTSFNHLCALLNGSLQFPYAGSGVFAFRFIAFVPLFHNIIDFQQLLGMPDLTSEFLSEFVATGRSGLNSNYIWPTAFGYYYSDLGGLVFVYLFASGLLVGYSWNSFVRGNAFGAVSYPYFAMTILLWFTSNMQALSPVVVVVVSGLGFSLIDRMARGSSLEIRGSRSLRLRWH